MRAWQDEKWANADQADKHLVIDCADMPVSVLKAYTESATETSRILYSRASAKDLRILETVCPIYAQLIRRSPSVDTGAVYDGSSSGCCHVAGWNPVMGGCAFPCRARSTTPRVSNMCRRCNSITFALQCNIYTALHALLALALGCSHPHGPIHLSLPRLYCKDTCINKF